MKIRCLAPLVLAALLLQTSCVSQELKKKPGSDPAAQDSDSRPPSEASPTLTIKANGQTRQFSRAQLLSSPLIKQIAIGQDPAYPKQNMTYSAVPVASLFSGLPADSNGTALFSCVDGFSAPISRNRLLNADPRQSIAYIAIEKPNERWPALKADEPAKTAGPFYLVWEHPERSGIKTEEWPFQLAGFELKPAIEDQFPRAAPDKGLPAGSRIRRGYKTFMQNCFACHAMNGEGTSQIGPDLNLPYNPTEYLKLNALVALIRNPQNLRHWPQAKMKGFDRSALSDSDVQEIILYLKHMSTQKGR